MGNRGQVSIREVGVHIYSQYGRSDMKHDVARALAKGRNKWNNPDNITSMVFAEMTADKTTIAGVGVSSVPYDNCSETVKVNCQLERITVIHGNGRDEEYDFGMFIKEFAPEHAKEVAGAYV